MRKIATVNKRNSEIRRLMIFESCEGVYVFQFTTNEDGPCTFDGWFGTLKEAEEWCITEYGVDVNEWKIIEDPLPGCQEDWITPTQVRRDAEGKPIWGEFERVDE